MITRYSNKVLFEPCFNFLRYFDIEISRFKDLKIIRSINESKQAFTNHAQTHRSIIGQNILKECIAAETQSYGDTKIQNCIQKKCSFIKGRPSRIEVHLFFRNPLKCSLLINFWKFKNEFLKTGNVRPSKKNKWIMKKNWDLVK